MAAVTPPWGIQASSHPADVVRRNTQMLGLGSQGVRLAGDLLVTANGSPNMSVNVAAGQALVAGTQNLTSQGTYGGLLNDATVNLAIAAADPTNPRIDIVCATVRDAAYSGTNNDWLLQVITGTPAPSPSPPATPNNAIVLAQVAVAANVTSIVSGNITDKRPFLQAVSALGVKGVSGNLIGGAPPAVGPTNWLIQGGTIVATTTAGGVITITFPVAFPTGIVSILPGVGDNAQSLGMVQLLASTVSLTSFNVGCLNTSGAGINTQAVRVNWIAIGW